MVVVYNKTATSEALPVRYMSPEAIERRRFSEKSDVWAFGVLLWEIATLCMFPYDSLGVHVGSDNDVKSGICNGSLRLPRPPGCPEPVFRIMLACWEASAQSRPNFRELRFIIQEAAFELQVNALPNAPSQGSPRLLQPHPFRFFYYGRSPMGLCLYYCRKSRQ